MKLRWFKHYNTATNGQSLTILWEAGHFDAIAFYWRLLEMISRWESPDARGQITVNMGVLRRETNWHMDRIKKNLDRLSEHFGADLLRIEFETHPKRKCDSKLFRDCLVTISAPNWSELQENRGGKKNQNSGKTPGEVRSKNELLRNSLRLLEADRQQQPTLSSVIPSSAENCDASFNGEGLAAIESVLQQAYAGHAKRYHLRPAPRILAHFYTASDFAAWVERVINAKNCPDPENDLVGFDSYFSKALNEKLRGQP